MFGEGADGLGLLRKYAAFGATLRTISEELYYMSILCSRFSPCLSLFLYALFFLQLQVQYVIEYGNIIFN